MRTIKIFSAICLAAMFSLGVSSCGNSKASDHPTNISNENTITIQAMQFQPATLTVVPGSEITWVNMDTTAHAVVSDNGTSFNSGSINPKGTYTYIANQNGSITYHCSVHPQMKGTIQVVTK